MTTTHTLAPGWTLTHKPEIEAVIVRAPGPGQYTCTGPDAPDHHGRLWYALGLELAASAGDAAPSDPFQNYVQPWLMACFGEEIANDREERNHRFLEEALELVQSCGCTASEAHQLVDYVFGRPVGEPAQEAGGVMVTLAALCLANGLDMHEAGEVELARIWTKVDAIRAKQAAKPKHSPLPAADPSAPAAPQVAAAPADEREAFEAWWASDHGMSASATADCLRWAGYYLNSITGREWRIWQAARAAAPEVAAPQVIGWLKFDPMSPPPDGLYWAMVSEPEIDCDVDDYGRTVGWHTGETIRRVAMLHFDGVDDDGPNFTEVNDWELGKWNGECRVTHLLPVAIPTAPDADHAAQAACKEGGAA